MRIGPDSPRADDVRALLDEHLDDMHATSPPESVHAMDHAALLAPAVTFWSVRAAGPGTTLLGVGALLDLGDGTGEVKSMRTAATARGRGVAATMLRHLVAEARARGWTDLHLETGSQDYFAPARRLYARHGFVERGPFGAYRLDPSSVFMTLALAGAGDR